MPKSHVITALAQQHNSAISLHFYVFRPRMMTELICSWHLSFAPVVCLPSKTQTGKVWQAPKATSAFVEDNIENCWKNRASSVRNGFPDVVKTNLAWQDRSCLKLELGIVQTCQCIGLDTGSRKILFLLPDVLNPIWTTTIHCRCSTKLVFHFNGDLGNQEFTPNQVLLYSRPLPLHPWHKCCISVGSTNISKFGTQPYLSSFGFILVIHLDVIRQTYFLFDSRQVLTCFNCATPKPGGSLNLTLSLEKQQRLLVVFNHSHTSKHFELLWQL